MFANWQYRNREDLMCRTYFSRFQHSFQINPLNQWRWSPVRIKGLTFQTGSLNSSATFITLEVPTWRKKTCNTEWQEHYEFEFNLRPLDIWGSGRNRVGERMLEGRRPGKSITNITFTWEICPEFWRSLITQKSTFSITNFT